MKRMQFIRMRRNAVKYRLEQRDWNSLREFSRAPEIGASVQGIVPSSRHIAN